MTRLLLLLCTLVLSGCAGFGLQQSNDMSAAQITAAVKDKNASVICNKTIAAGFSLETIIITLDKDAIKDGGVSANNQGGCNATITSAAPPRPAVPVAPKEPAK